MPQEMLLVALKQAGVIARRLQGSVTNEEKPEDTSLPNDDDALRARRAAKTAVDEIVQDIILLAVRSDRGSGFVLDAEEDTTLRSQFSGGKDDPVLVLDPIDGTIDYIEGRSSYSVCAGISAAGRFEPVYVYFPARDTLYFIGEDHRSYVWRDFSGVESAATPLAEHVPDQKLIYLNRRVPAALQDRLRAHGYDIHDDTENLIGAADCLLACIEGRALCYLSHSRQMRDIMLGAVAAAVPNGYALDWSGKALDWPRSGRVPHAVFGLGALPADVSKVLAEYA